MYLILCVCTTIVSIALGIAGYSIDHWLFWVVFVCHLTICISACIKDYKQLNRFCYYPPFKVGDTVYWAWDLDEDYAAVEKGKVRGLSVGQNGTTWFSVVYDSGLTFEHTFKDYWGKSVFLTEIEAEIALKKKFTEKRK